MIKTYLLLHLNHIVVFTTIPRKYYNVYNLLWRKMSFENLDLLEACYDRTKPVNTDYAHLM